MILSSNTRVQKLKAPDDRGRSLSDCDGGESDNRLLKELTAEEVIAMRSGDGLMIVGNGRKMIGWNFVYFIS